MGLQEGRKGSVDLPKALTIIVTAMVVVTIAVALWVAGSPATERSRRLDNQRLSDLQAITYAVDAYYTRNASLPGSIDDLMGTGPDNYYGLGRTTDPVTEMPYEYRVVSGATYEVCATFDVASDVEDKELSARMPYPAGPQWTYTAGYHCFTVDAEERTASVACSLTQPCPASQSCVTLPGKKGASCVPAGKECLAAGCPDTCAIAESYPAQVRCME